MQTANNVILYAEICQYLSFVDNEKSGLFAGGNDLTLPRKLYMVRKNLSFLYSKSAADERVLPLTNYLFWLCGKYAAVAQSMSGNGGSIAGVVLPTDLEVLDFVVSSTSIIPTGESTLTIEEFKGFNIEFARGGVVQYQTDNQGSYFSWNKVTGEFICFPAADENEPFRISPTV